MINASQCPKCAYRMKGGGGWDRQGNQPLLSVATTLTRLLLVLLGRWDIIHVDKIGGIVAYVQMLLIGIHGWRAFAHTLEHETCCHISIICTWSEMCQLMQIKTREPNLIWHPPVEYGCKCVWGSSVERQCIFCLFINLFISWTG